MMTTITSIKPAQFWQYQHSQEHCVIDVRERTEYASGSEASCCWPLSEINANTASYFVKSQHITPDKTLVLLCAGGVRAQQAAEKLQALLPNRVAVVEGGRAALMATDGTISIERQVRIAAGALVLLGIVASLVIHPAALLLSAFIGAGLIFAGVSNWCGMALLLMKMPWNKK